MNVRLLWWRSRDTIEELEWQARMGMIRMCKRISRTDADVRTSTFLWIHLESTEGVSGFYRVGFGGKINGWRHDQMVEFGLNDWVSCVVARGLHNWVYCCLLVGDDDDDASQQEQWTLFSLQHFALHRIGQPTDRQTSEAENECAMPMRLRCFIITLWRVGGCGVVLVVVLVQVDQTGALGSGTLHCLNNGTGCSRVRY